MISTLDLQNYRNLTQRVDLEKNNLIIAPNGSGKSNLLESIYLTALGKSFRPVSGLDEFIGPEQQFGKVEITYHQDTLETIISGGTTLKRRYLWNRKTIAVNKVIGKVPVILFAPHHVSLVANDPASRREDLDDFLSILYPEYSETLTKFKKVLKNRNALLKNLRDHGGNSNQLEYWTDEFVTLANTLYESRQGFIEEVTEFVANTASDIYHKHTFEFRLNYLPNSYTYSVPYQDELTNKLYSNQNKEIIVGTTLYGPQKDDYEILYNDQNLRYLGSRGEQRLAAFIWKLAQHRYFMQVKDQNAILLIDDLMSELDQSHRESLTERLLEGEFQYILVAAERTDVPTSLIESASIIDLQGR